MKDDASGISRWRPRSGRSEMMGAVGFFLNIQKAKVILHGPRWCSLPVEDYELFGIPGAEVRLFCLQLEEKDMLFGAEDSLEKALSEAGITSEDSLIIVISHGTESLIGDDVDGICQRMGIYVPVISMEAGGFNRFYGEGWSRAFAYMAEAASSEACISDNVPAFCLTGLDINDPYCQGDQAEMVRMLSRAGLFVRKVSEALGLLYGQIQDMRKAKGYIVLHQELAEEAVQYIERHFGVPYVNAGVPYGVRQSLEWVRKVCCFCGIKPYMKDLEKEGEQIVREVYMRQSDIKGMFKSMVVKRIIVCGLSGTAIPLAEALRELFPGAEFFLDIEENQNVGPFLFWDRFADGDHLDSGECQILCGSEEDFSCLSGTGTILFVNLSSWNRRIHVQGMTLAGIRGWAWLTEFLFHELYTAAQYRRG